MIKLEIACEIPREKHAELTKLADAIHPLIDYDERIEYTQEDGDLIFCFSALRPANGGPGIEIWTRKKPGVL